MFTFSSPAVHSVPNRNEYQGICFWVKCGRRVELTALPSVSCAECQGKDGSRSFHPLSSSESPCLVRESFTFTWCKFALKWIKRGRLNILSNEKCVCDVDTESLNLSS